MLPSERVISCVKVYGRLGRRRSVACLHCMQMKVILVGLERTVVAVWRMGKGRDIMCCVVCVVWLLFRDGWHRRNDFDSEFRVQMRN